MISPYSGGFSPVDSTVKNTTLLPPFWCADIFPRYGKCHLLSFVNCVYIYCFTEERHNNMRCLSSHYRFAGKCYLLSKHIKTKDCLFYFWLKKWRFCQLCTIFRVNFLHIYRLHKCIRESPETGNISVYCSHHATLPIHHPRFRKKLTN